MKYTLPLVLLLSLHAWADDVEVEIGDLLTAAEVKYALPEGILHAMAYVESSNDETVVIKHDGKTGKASYGLLQVQLDTARFIQKLKSKTEGFMITKHNRITPKELLKPEVNIEYSAYYLKWLLKNHKNNTAWALSCYNGGPTGYMCKNRRYGQYAGLVLNAMLR